MSSINSVLFVCYGNTCRSVMAEYIMRYLAPPEIEIGSAGMRLNESEVAPYAIKALEKLYSLPSVNHIPKKITDVDLDSFDVIVALDKWVARQLQSLTDRNIIQWDINDPYGDDYMQYQRTAILLKQKIESFLDERGITSET